MRKRTCLIAAAALFVVLVLIGMFVRDGVVRPYGGDVLVVIFLYALVRGLTPLGRWLAAGAVFAFACALEMAQAFDLATRLGLMDNAVARTVIGTYPDLLDVAMYAAGLAAALLLDRPVRTRA
jgi:hypothetical protein